MLYRIMVLSEATRSRGSLYLTERELQTQLTKLVLQSTWVITLYCVRGSVLV